MAQAIHVFQMGVNQPPDASHLLSTVGQSCQAFTYLKLRHRRSRFVSGEAMADPTTSPVKLQRLRERAARPQYELLRSFADLLGRSW